ncbi:MAG: DUF1360 domain-containing protein [Thermovirgaceae bacterium]|jgi:hypothetical protein
MPELWEILIIAAAAWRIVTFIQDEAGPFAVMYHIRRLLGVVHDDDRCPVGWPDNLIGSLLKCAWCLSFWVGVIMYLFWLLTPIIPLIFAISTGAILISEIIQRLKNGNR